MVCYPSCRARADRAPPPCVKIVTVDFAFFPADSPPQMTASGWGVHIGQCTLCTVHTTARRQVTQGTPCFCCHYVNGRIRPLELSLQQEGGALSARALVIMFVAIWKVSTCTGYMFGNKDFFSYCVTKNLWKLRWILYMSEEDAHHSSFAICTVGSRPGLQKNILFSHKLP